MNDQGCTDGNCKLRLHPVTGQHTNGGCNCLRDIPTKKRLEIERKLAHLTSWKTQFQETSAIQNEVICKATETIDDLRATNAELVAAVKDAIDCLQDNGHFDASETVDRLRSALTAEGEA